MKPEILFSVIAILFASCSSSKVVLDTPQKITGEIMVVGNEPFTRIAARTTNGDVYLINCNNEIRQSLLSHQGKIAELFYNEIQKKKNSVTEINVVKVNYLSK